MAELFGGISDVIMDGLQAILYATIYKLLYYMAIGCCWIVNLLYSMFEVMAGLGKVSYDGSYDYLINVFFSNTTVSKVYWGMALIGVLVGFGFAIAAVIKKLFDTNEKEKRSYGQILTGLFKSVLIILCMSLIITMVLNATTLLMQQINYVFINADDLGEEETITFTDEEYAAMARVLNTIGNFSLNPSYNNRYNLNKCFNEIRFDLQYLKAQGVFDFHYVTTDVEGNTIATWQSALQRIANAASLDRDLSLDVYHESVSNAILQTMDLLKVNGSFKPLKEYQRHYLPTRSSISMDRILFLMASMRAAKNEDYNINPSLTDPLRGAYYYGEKSIYDLDTVNEDFDIGIAALDYIVLFLTCFKMLQTLVTIILNCVGRIFNMLLLYLISPVIVAVSPLDDGAKFKQWTTAFIVQSFSVFGTVISMRVLLLFMPIVTDSKLVMFSNPVGNLLAKLVIILGAFEVAEKATSLITGILADNAGWQSINAGDMSGTAKSAVAVGKKMASSFALGGVGGLAMSAVGLGVKGGGKAAVGVGLGVGYGVYGLGKGAVVGTKAIANKISAWRNSGKGDGGDAAGQGNDVETPGGAPSDAPVSSQNDDLPSNQRPDLTDPQMNQPPNEQQQISQQQNNPNQLPVNQHQVIADGGNVNVLNGGHVNAPNGGNVNAPNGGNVNAPNGGNVNVLNGGNVNAPKGGNVNAPKGGNVNVLNGGHVNAPNGGNVNAPKGGNVNAPNGSISSIPGAPAKMEGAAGVQTRIAELEARMQAGRQPAPPVNQPKVQVSDNIKSRAAALEAQMNGGAPKTKPIPTSLRGGQNNN